MMTDRLAETIAAKFRDVAGPKIAAAFHPDDYEIYRVDKVRNEYGDLEDVPVIVETGTCSLERSMTQGGERVVDAVVLTESDYTVEISSPESLLTTNHVLVINGRTFDVIDVQREGKAGMFTYAAVNEEGPR